MLNRQTLRLARPRAELRAGRTDWYRIVNVAERRAEVYIYDEIGYFGITAGQFVEELRNLVVDEIDLHVNSPGGEIFDGIAIFNCLNAHRARVTSYVDGLAASIASVITMAGERVVMGRNSQMMIHDGMGLCIGNAEDMRRMAEDLDRQSDNIAAVYTDRAGGSVDEWRERMRAETWFTADEAVSAGLADEVVAPTRGGAPATENNWDLSIFRYAGRDAAPAPVATGRAPAPAVPQAPPPWPAPAPTPAPLIAFDVDDFRGVFADLRENAPAVPDPVREPVPAVAPGGLPFDIVDIRLAMMDSLRSASRPAEPDDAPIGGQT